MLETGTRNRVQAPDRSSIIPSLMTDSEFDIQAYKNALSCFATGVAIATTLDASGNRVGMTVSSFNSVSLDPPLVLWSIANTSRGHDVFVHARYFGVNVLAVHQKDISTQFSQKSEDKFAGLVCRDGIGGVPMLPEYAACFECETEHVYEGGDHKIIVGRVVHFEDHKSDPLIFYRGQYMRNDGSYPGEI